MLPATGRPPPPGTIATNSSVTDPFQLVVPEARLDEHFSQVAEARGYAPARAAIRECFAKMGDRDPNFVEQLQTTGFDARLSELYLFTAFDSAGFDVGWEGEAPDFLLAGHGHEWAVEATTANPSGGGPPPSLPGNLDDLRAYIDGELVVRLGSALFSKLSKRYWELPHVAGKPLVLAIQNFASEEAQQLADTALLDYLYGLHTVGEVDADGRLEVRSEEITEHVGSKTIPSNFFSIPDARHISAVLWTNSGTIAKFARMGFQQGLDSKNIHMIREGLRFVMDPDATEPAPFRYEVGSRMESWEEGLVMAHNPNADLPLPIDAFPGIVHHELIPSGLVEATLPRFHAFRSKTLIVAGR
jgi:hypothetical protein